MYFHGFQILHMHIATVEKLTLTTTGSPLQIRCKTFLSVTFVIPKERDCHEVFVTLQQLAQPGMATLIFLHIVRFEIYFQIKTNVFEQFYLLEYTAVWSIESQPMFRRNMSPAFMLVSCSVYSLTRKMKPTCSS
jgi:hypothetical protein